MSIESNLNEIRKTIPAACSLIAVSKTQPTEKIQEAYNSGQRDFGENRAQEMQSKYRLLPKDIRWHMIGHLQTNKVKYVAPFVTLIHSIDSIRLLEEVDRQGARLQRNIPCLLQVHIAEEESKFGFSADEIFTLMSSSFWQQPRNVTISGLMGMATFTDDRDQVRKEFRGLKALFDKLGSSALPAAVTMKTLSMGMSGDYRVAIEEGSNMVRVGTAIFGERKPRPA